jgi:hypothetical protein
MKSLIAVRGAGHCGKSASIKKAYELLRGAYPNAKVEEVFVRVDITIVISIDGVKIGIESHGDPTGRLPKTLMTFLETGCKVIICATRTSGQTVDAVNALAGQYRIEWIEKSSAEQAEEQEAANVSTARQILAAAQAAIHA